MRLTLQSPHITGMSYRDYPKPLTLSLNWGVRHRDATVAVAAAEDRQPRMKGDCHDGFGLGCRV